MKLSEVNIKPIIVGDITIDIKDQIVEQYLEEVLYQETIYCSKHHSGNGWNIWLSDGTFIYTYYGAKPSPSNQIKQYNKFSDKFEELMDSDDYYEIYDLHNNVVYDLFDLHSENEEAYDFICNKLKEYVTDNLKLTL